MGTDKAIPIFPVPDFDAPTVAFGAPRSAYISAESMPREFYEMRHPMCDVASALFYKGGKLADHGLKLRPGIDAGKAWAALRALLGSWEPKHEIKIGTVGIALAQWCEPASSSKKAKGR